MLEGAAKLRFTAICGHEAILAELAREVRYRELTHAYLFEGPPNVGKYTTARALAAAVLCPHSRERGEACGACESCQLVAKGIHPNLYLASGEGSIKIAEVRRLTTAASYRGHQGGYQVFLLGDAERLTAEAANALLKTLEEPGIGTLFILTSSLPEVLPATIISRCRRMRFAPLPARVVAQGLVAAGIAEGEALRFGRACGGRIGMALSQAQYPDEGGRQELLARVEVLLGGGGEALLEAGRLAEAGEPLLVIIFLQEFLRDLLVAMVAGEELVLHQDLLPLLRRVTAVSGTVEKALGEALEGERLLAAGANKRLILEVLSLSLGQLAASRDKGGLSWNGW